MIQKIIEDWIENNHVPTVNIEGYLMVNREDLTKLLVKYKSEQLLINGVVFNEAEDCRKCLKPKRMKPNTIQMLCECVDSEVELPNKCKVCGRTDEERLTMTSMCGVSACPY